MLKKISLDQINIIAKQICGGANSTQQPSQPTTSTEPAPMEPLGGPQNPPPPLGV